MTQSSLRTALQQLETMASVRAARIKDKLNAGLQRMTSHRVFDGVFRHGVVGREVSACSRRAGTRSLCRLRPWQTAMRVCAARLVSACLRPWLACACLTHTGVCWRCVLQVMRDWELGPTLGLGASCVTRLVTDKTTGRTAACKSISKQGILHSPQVKAAMLAVQREVAIMQVGVA